MGFQFGEKNWGFKCFLFLFFVFLVKSDRVREYDKRESVRECEVPIWNGGQMVLRWWRDDGDLEKASTLIRQGGRCGKNWFLF